MERKFDYTYATQGGYCHFGLMEYIGAYYHFFEYRQLLKKVGRDNYKIIYDSKRYSIKLKLSEKYGSLEVRSRADFFKGRRFLEASEIDLDYESEYNSINVYNPNGVVGKYYPCVLCYENEILSSFKDIETLKKYVLEYADKNNIATDGLSWNESPFDIDAALVETDITKGRIGEEEIEYFKDTQEHLKKYFRENRRSKYVTRHKLENNFFKKLELEYLT
jgi:hypothetical protein